jgi:malonyl CoA-acyl carrier protein transacylase
MKTYLFPGQGSQVKGMGKELFDEFKELVQEADDVLGYSVKKLCLEDPNRELNKTLYTQPALFVVNALHYLESVRLAEAEPDYLAGHSLGEYNALLAAGAFSFDVGLRLVKMRAELMSRASGGGMAAILNADETTIRSLLEKAKLTSIDLANFNTQTQIVISGLTDEIKQAEAVFRKANYEYYPLNTSGAFHSRHMRDSAVKFESYLEQFGFSKLRIPVIANCTAKPYEDHEARINLAKQIISPVKWYESMKYLLDIGDMSFEESRHSEVLTKMIGHIRSRYSRQPVDRPVLDSTGSPQNAINAWNRRHPVGTEVRSKVVPNKVLKTRTQAVLLFGRRAAVYLEGYKGFFDLNELSVIGN